VISARIGGLSKRMIGMRSVFQSSGNQHPPGTMGQDTRWGHTLGTSSLTLSTSPLISLISPRQLSSASRTEITASSTSETTLFTRTLYISSAWTVQCAWRGTNRSSSKVVCSLPVCSCSSKRSLAASSYWAVISAEVDWKAVVEGGWRWGTRYFYSVSIVPSRHL